MSLKPGRTVLEGSAITSRDPQPTGREIEKAAKSFAAWREDFYLRSSEAGFRERRLGDVQALFAKPGWK